MLINSDKKALKDIDILSEEKSAEKLVGVEYEGIMCSATKEDMWGLASCSAWVSAGNETNFVFDNGNSITLTSENYDAFYAVWAPFRASFFE